MAFPLTRIVDVRRNRCERGLAQAGRATLLVLCAACGGGDRTSVTSPPSAPAAPSTSAKIDVVFMRQVNDSAPARIYGVAVDGTGETALTPTGEDFGDPVWSPDGSRIAYDACGAPQGCVIGVMDASGGNRRTIAPGVNPSWSPDGQRLAYRVSTKDDSAGIPHSGEIWVVNLDGTGRTRISDSTRIALSPNWSPDGQRIAFSGRRTPLDTVNIYSMRTDGSDVVRLTAGLGRDLFPGWSPDARRIAFLSNRTGRFDAYVMNADGSSQTRVTNGPAQSLGFDWSPDGTQFVSVDQRDGPGHLYLINGDGSSVRRLTNSSAPDGAPSWRRR